ncbi:MAG: hypothetical protein HYV63_07055 [Candidatus Schekmanbacteria bacterium]|nr:hypothetical protein [Candidatus Schekmanbacteria bacterium]
MVSQQVGRVVAVAFGLGLFAAATGGRALADTEAEKGALATWFSEHVLFNMQLLPLVNVQHLSLLADNPRNDLKKLDRYSYELHIRPDVAVEAGPVRLGASPRLVGIYRQFRDGTRSGENDSDVDFFLREGYLKWRPVSSLTVAVERKNLQWGSGFLTSPSNPFYELTGRSRPYRELGGKDFASLSYAPNDFFSIMAYANFARGEADETERFRAVYAVKAELTFDQLFFSPVLSYVDGDRVRAGGYGNWSVSEAVLLFFDAAFTRGTVARYAEVDPEDPFGLAFRDAKRESRKLIPQLLVGGSYTFLSGTAIYGEYLHYGPGYSNAEAKRYYDLLDRSEEPFLYRGDDPNLQLLAGLAARNLGYAASNRLAFQRRNYVMIYVTRTDWFERLDPTVGWAQNLDDGSYYAYASVEAKLFSRMKLFTNTLYYSSAKHTELAAPFDYSQAIGLKVFF